MNARLYDPILHTFLSPDALISDPNNPQNYNRYAYALNNPLMYADYDGNEPITIAMVVTAAIIGAIIGGVTYVGLSLYNGTAITWGGLAKSIIVGAVSGVASMSIGAVAQSVTTTIFGTSGTGFVNMALLAVTKGAMHGAAQGIIQGVSGGNAGQSFITAMATSIAGDAFGAIGGKVGELTDTEVGHSLFGAITGGVVSNMQGGNFWEGATIGLTVGLLNHASKPLSKAIDRWLNGNSTIVAGIYGAGGDEAGDNPKLQKIVEARGGTMFTSSLGGGDYDIIQYIKGGFDAGKRVIIYGYSRGATAAVRIANILGEMSVTITQMILFDPVGFYGGGNLVFKYPNVMKVINYYQRNSTDWGPSARYGKLPDNPFIGSPVNGNFQFPEINNVNYTGNGSVNHLNIIRYVTGK
jgi:hypothetical protein